VQDKIYILPQLLLQGKDIKDRIAIQEKDYRIWLSYTKERGF
jgi:hypothetical protein